MQASKSIKVAVIPFKRGQESASVCGDGDHFAAIWNGVHKSFTSLWWAVNYVLDNGFAYDWESMKIYANESFETICRPHGYAYKKVGCSWYFQKDGVLVRSSSTLWEGQFACICDCYAKKIGKVCVWDRQLYI